ncbi:hypothetical protein RvY_00062-1 [Ramazzottius varieornatus]|uniref:Uncharacterized protein n=1 Tax=Ramazzottius varieornatus TaxID=947166 RepID=A0A1D1UF59_RAMVA|nr:hypothetical protein RvY_00062-1 [Ramazzottius varieornatus]
MIYWNSVLSWTFCPASWIHWMGASRRILRCVSRTEEEGILGSRTVPCCHVESCPETKSSENSLRPRGDHFLSK